MIFRSKGSVMKTQISLLVVPETEVVSFHHMLVLTRHMEENVITCLILQTKLIEPTVRTGGFIEQMGTHVPLEHDPERDMVGE